MKARSERSLDVRVEFVRFEMEECGGKAWKLASKYFVHALRETIEQALTIAAAIISRC